MKAAIHPKYFTEGKIVCACGNTFTVGSTVEEIHVELCNRCHPFYTGQQKLVDTARRVEKFGDRIAATAAKAATTAGKKAKTAKRTATKEAKKAAKTVTKLEA